MTTRPTPSHPARQQDTLAEVSDRLTNKAWLEGALVVGSMAAGTADPASDIDLIICTKSGHFDAAWQDRHRLHGPNTLACWDQHATVTDIGTHRWVTHDVVLVEALFATPTSGVRLAPPWKVIAGNPNVPTLFPHRPSIDRSEMTKDTHPIEQAFDQLKEVLRRYTETTPVQ
jgi:hypothetical protein